MGRHARLKKAISHLEWESSPIDKDAVTRPLVSHASHHNKIQESNQQDNSLISYRVAMLSGLINQHKP